MPEAQESPSKGSNVSEDIPAEGNVASGALFVAESVDVLANDPVVVSSDSEWDYEERPLTQLSPKRSLEEARESYCAATWAAPTTPADSPVSPMLLSRLEKCGDRAFLLGTFLA